MEARRTFVGARSYKQLWIILAALLAAAMLAVGASFIAGSGAIGVTKPSVVTHAAPGTVLRQDYDGGSAPAVNNSPKTKQTVF
ncbi:MAG TPA: hypothetical protein VGV88_08620 [Candidatus Dormibacteraeota bacterium]|nr:hypothetical protein [Candidatus Dormibacteraeota bacterium]